MLQRSVGILGRQARQHGDLLGHRLAGKGKICHLAGRILHIFKVFDQLAVFFVLAQGKDLPVHTLGAHPGDLVQKHLLHRVGGIALAGEQDAAATIHPQHFPAKARVHKAPVVQAAVQRRHAAADAAEDQIIQCFGAQVAKGQRFFFEAHAEAGLGHRHFQRFFGSRQRHGFRLPKALHALGGAGLQQAMALAGG